MESLIDRSKLHRLHVRLLILREIQLSLNSPHLSPLTRKEFKMAASNTLATARAKAEVHPDSPAAPLADAKQKHAGIIDVRSEFDRISKATPRDPAAEQAFILNKVHALMTHPQLDATTRAALTGPVMGRIRPPEGS